MRTIKFYCLLLLMVSVCAPGSAAETDIKYAVGALSVPLRLKSQPGRYIRTNEQEIVFALEVK